MSTSDTTNALLTVNKQLASYFTVGKSATAEGGFAVPRGTAYGEQFVNAINGEKLHAAADEGSYYVATNVPQTPIIDTAALTAFAATTPTMVLFNNNALGGKSIYLQRLRMSVAAAGTSGTNWLWQWLVDTGNRYTSGGTLLTLANLNLLTATASGMIAHFGAITAPAANASRIVAAGLGRTVIKVIGDEYTFEFGGSTPLAGAGMPTEGTLQLTKTWAVPPIVIPPQNSALLYEYAASQGTAASFDNICLDYVER